LLQTNCKPTTENWQLIYHAAMQLWFARGSDVSIREQLVTQIILGILSDDLAPGQRLPSTREVARRFHLHPNTVSAGYRQLQRDRWVDFRRGSGVYVRSSKPETALPASLALDQMIAGLFRSAQKLGVSLPELRSRLQQWLELQPPGHFVLIEPDRELRAILRSEMAKAVSFPVKCCGIEDWRQSADGGIPVMLPNREATVRKLLAPGTEAVILQVRSASASLTAYLPAPAGALVGIASRWPEFLKMARAMLTAVGFHPDGLVFRDAREANWHRGLKETAAVVCDTVTAGALPAGCRALPFALLSDASVTELRRHEAFVRQPITSL